MVHFLERTYINSIGFTNDGDGRGLLLVLPPEDNMFLLLLYDEKLIIVLM